jgi:hypothetical protein
MTKKEIMEAIKAWREENEERAAFVLLVDEDHGLAQAVTGKGIDLIAAVGQVAENKEIRAMIKEALAYGEIYASMRERIREEVEKELKEAKEKGEGD